MMSGKVCIVTGATGGIGLETARGLCASGATVGIVGRSQEKGQAALAQLAAVSSVPPVFLQADLSRMEEVRRLGADIATRFDRLDVLINNAGLMVPKRQLTPDGFETTFATNHLSHFLLTGLLLDLIKRSAPSRIINVSSDAHRFAKLDFADLQGERGYRMFRAYGRSKLANLYFTFELARRLAGSGVTVNAVHPGLVASDFFRSNGLAALALKTLRPFMLSSARGAETSLHLATAPELAGVTGRYFHGTRERPLSATARDVGAAVKLWDISEELTDFPYASTLLPGGAIRPASVQPGV